MSFLRFFILILFFLTYIWISRHLYEIFVWEGLETLSVKTPENSYK